MNYSTLFESRQLALATLSFWSQRYASCLLQCTRAELRLINTSLVDILFLTHRFAAAGTTTAFCTAIFLYRDHAVPTEWSVTVGLKVQLVP